MNSITNIIIVSVAVALIYAFIIKPRQDKKAAEAKKNHADTDASSANDTHGVMQDEPLAKKERKEKPWIDSDGFTKEEVTAMCVVALSLVDAKIYNPKVMMKFMHEQVGIEEDEVYHKMHNLIDEMPKALPVVKAMQNAEKRKVAAAFFAASIEAVGYADDKDAILGWGNCAKYLLHLSGDDCNFEKTLQRYDKSLISK